MIKAIYENPTANIILDSDKLKVFPLRLGARPGCPQPPPSFNRVPEAAEQIGKKKE